MSGVVNIDAAAPFPLVRRARPDLDEIEREFFSSRRESRPSFEELFTDPAVEETWRRRRGRRIAVRALASVSLVALVAGVVLSARQYAHARSAVTDWATLGQLR
ncbi:MAG TPA: hypothetical protein VHB21_20335 [Minicystis sp.]|nr:hypothetical protein [Minicystis sp.]